MTRGKARGESEDGERVTSEDEERVRIVLRINRDEKRDQQRAGTDRSDFVYGLAEILLADVVDQVLNLAR